jgi:hypothetical protein
MVLCRTHIQMLRHIGFGSPFTAAAAICLHLTRLSNANCCRVQKFVGLFAAAQGPSSIL